MFNRFYLEWKMRSALFRWTTNFLLVLIISGTAWLGSNFGIQWLSLEFSVVWPATGFALAAILLFGSKVWPGVFFGNLLYNFFSLYYDVEQIVPLIRSLVAAILVSMGSTTQALVAGAIIRRFSHDNYFSSLKEVLIFLIPAGLFASMIASSIGIVTFYLLGFLSATDFLSTWFTFWIGDLMGVYLVTPLLVVWSLHLPSYEFRQYFIEVPLIATLFVLLCVASFMWNYPVVHLFLPLCLWTTYRFGMHGATLSVLLTSLAAIVPTSLGAGPFITAHLSWDPLIVLVTFLEVIVATTLIVAGVLKDREKSWQLIKKQNIELQEEVNNRIEEIRDMYNELLIKDKKASIGTIYFSISQQMLASLKKIRKSAKASMKSLGNLDDSLELHKHSLDENLCDDLLEKVKKIEHYSSDIVASEKHANEVAKLYREQIAHPSKGKLKIKEINLHTLLNQCIEKGLKNRENQYPLSVHKHYDRNVTTLTAMPGELAYAFLQLIGRNIASTQKKWDHLGGDYQPSLEISTMVDGDHFEVTLQDNGEGVPTADLKNFFNAFVETEEHPIKSDFGLTLAHEIIVRIHHGTIRIESQPGEYLLFKIFLPRSPLPSSLLK